MRRWICGLTGIALSAATSIVFSGPAQADSFRNDQWYLHSLDISKAHSITDGSGVIVGVVDSGVYRHPDVRQNLLSGTDVTTGDDNGNIDTVGHGTNMAAIIAAHGRNDNSGVLGIAPAAKILPIKIAVDRQANASAQLARGVEWAVQHRARVINISVATGPSFELVDAVKKAINDDVVVVSASGNDIQGSLIGFPASIDGVLAVGATGANGKHAPFSNRSSRILLCAPGEKITTAQPPDRYVNVDGTSAATAVVSGAVALVRARFPRLSAKDVIHRLTATADDIGPPGRDDQCGYGALNIIKALTADIPPTENSVPATSAATDSRTQAEPTMSDSSRAAQGPIQDTGSQAPILIAFLLVALSLAGLVGYGVLRRRKS